MTLTRAVFYATLTLALGAGVLSLVMFWLAMLGLGWSIAAIAMLSLGITGGSMLFLHRAILRQLIVDEWAKNPGIMGIPKLEMFAVFLILIIAAAILFNGAYFPFARDDALGIYRPTALAMWQTGTLEPLIGADSLYRAYPILVPLNYTFVYMVSGWENEYLAKTIATLLSLGCLPAVYFLGREIGGRRVGILAALILALTPSFVRWGSSGYVDLPMAFYYTLGAFFALRFYRSTHWIDAALAGVMIGFAAITKNAGLIGIPLLAGWFAVVTFKNLLTQRQKHNAKTQSHEGAKRVVNESVISSNIPINSPFASLRHSAFALCLSLFLAALIAAPWYLRNLAGAGFIIPATAWTDQADRSLRTLGIFITLYDNFLVSGWLVLAGVGFALWQIAVHRIKADASLLSLWFTLPFFAAWWLFVSYDPRFLLLFYPILCIGAASLVDAILRRRPLSRPAQIVTALAVSALALYCIWIAVEFKGDILRNPLMTHAEKVALVRDQP